MEEYEIVDDPSSLSDLFSDTSDEYVLPSSSEDKDFTIVNFKR